MRKTLSTFLLLGYVMLVPFCFFGSTMMADAHPMSVAGSATHPMNDCEMPLDGCANGMGSNGMDTVSHHASMYYSITQSPLVVFSIMLAALVSIILIALSFVHNWLSVLFLQITIRTRMRRSEEIPDGARASILPWLSLFETSPNFA